MFNGNMGPSLSDIAAVTRDNDGIGSGNGWWILIILFALFGGWGNGWGGYAGGGGERCATQADVRAAVDQQTLISKIDGQTYGIADLGHMINTSFSAAELSRANQQAALVAQITAAQTANQQNFTMLQNQMNQNTQNIMANDNANYRQLHDEIIGLQMESLKSQIAQRDQQIFQLQLTASQQEQNNYIVGQLKQCPIPAFVVPNPYVSQNNCCTTSC